MARNFHLEILGIYLRKPAATYALSIVAVAAAVALRALLDPILGDSLPLVTLFGAVAAAVWIGGIRPAAVAAVVGYVACHYFFIEPRRQLDFATSSVVVGAVAYFVTCAIIIVSGEAARRAQDRATRQSQDRAGKLLEARLLAAIVESSDDGIISKSLDGIIQSWNAGAERIFGYPAARAIGQHIFLVIPGDRRAEEDHIIGLLKAGRRIDHFETVRVTADGRRIPVSLTISPLKDDSGQVIGASKIVRDITDRAKAEEQLREVDRRKDEFLATLAHELRGPLAPLSNMLEVLKRSEPGSGMFEQARGTMDRQLRQLNRLVDDLLDVNRISHNRLELRLEEVELATVIHQAVEAARPLAEAAAHQVHVTLPTTSVRLYADPARLAQVFGNLLNNSCKYTDPGGHISVNVSVVDNKAIVSVADTGVGIPADKINRVFDMFTQVDRSVERSRDGLGIGLTLVKRLVEMHGGSAEVRSAGPGRGSEFTIRLPLAPSPPRALPVVSPAEKTRKRRILVVDDNEDSAVSLAMLLGMMGHQTSVAHDGPQAIAAIETQRPDAVLLDIGLPELDGYAVCRHVRAQPWGKDIVLIALTGWGQDTDRRKSKEAGFDDHLVKPVDHRVLDELLSNLIRKSSPEHQPAAGSA